MRPSALLATQSVRRSHDGTTCCGLTPTLKRVDHLQRRRVDHVDRSCRAGWARRRAPASPCTRRARCAGCRSRCRGCRDRSPAACRAPSRSAAARGAGAACGGICAATHQAADAEGGEQARQQAEPNLSCACRRRESGNLRLSARRRAPDRGDAARDDQVDAELPERRARRPRVAGDAVAGGRRRRPCAIGAHQARVDGEHQRGVGGAGVRADLRRARGRARAAPARKAPRRRGSTRR